LPRPLFDKVRFNVDSAHDDWEFLLPVSKEAGARIETVPEVLAVIYFNERGSTNTIRTWSWARSLDWIDSMRPMISRHAHSGFCLGVSASHAVGEGAYAAFPELLSRAFRYGSPRLWQTLSLLGYWVMPLRLRARLRDKFRGGSPLPRAQRL
jgi:hypothetical protein